VRVCAAKIKDPHPCPLPEYRERGQEAVSASLNHFHSSTEGGNQNTASYSRAGPKDWHMNNWRDRVWFPLPVLRGRVREGAFVSR
jgi:hypothetical protein